MIADANTVAVEEYKICEDALDPVIAAQFDIKGRWPPFHVTHNASSIEINVPDNLGIEENRGSDRRSFASVGLESALPWMREGLQTIASLSRLDAEWHESTIAPPNAIAAELALNVLRCLSEIGFQPSSIDASTDEGICISFYAGARKANIECFNTGEILGATMRKGGEPYIWEMVTNTIPDGVAQIYSFVRG